MATTPIRRLEPHPWAAAGSGLLLLGALLRADSAAPSNSAAAPFLRFRDLELAYTGPAEDLTNQAEIRLGWFGPHDPPDSPAADPWWAAGLAVQEANQCGGLDGRPFRLVPRWATDPWGSGVAQLARMVYEEKPLAILGSVDSASTHLAEQVVAKANLPLISPLATDKSLTLAGVSWMFSCAPAESAVARLLAEGIRAALKGDSRPLILLVSTGHGSRMARRELLAELSRQGRQPDFQFEVPPGARALSHQLAALERTQPAAVVVLADSEDAARLVQRVREITPRSQIFGSPAMGRFLFRQLAGGAAEGVRFPLLFMPDTGDPVTARFLERFEAERGRAPDHGAALTYDATRLLLEAARRGGANRARVREALQQLSPWPGIAGLIHFDGTGQNTRTNLCLGTIRGGAVVPLGGQTNLDWKQDLRP